MNCLIRILASSSYLSFECFGEDFEAFFFFPFFVLVVSSALSVVLLHTEPSLPCTNMVVLMTSEVLEAAKPKQVCHEKRDLLLLSYSCCHGRFCLGVA